MRKHSRGHVVTRSTDVSASFTGSAPTVRRLERDLRSWTTTLKSLVVPDSQGLWGRWLDREGRSQGLVGKHHVKGELGHGDVICADAECLWVELKSGQQ